MFYLAWRNVLRRLGRSLATAVIVAVATLVLAASGVVVAAFEGGISLSRDRLGADIMVLPSGASSDASEVLFTAQPVNVYLAMETAEQIAGVDGVQAVTPQFFTQTVNQSCCSVVGVNRVVGIDAASDFVVMPWVQDAGDFKLASDQVLLGAAAPDLQGGQASILGSTFHVAGTLAETGTSVDETIFMDIESARRIAAESPYLTGVWGNTDPYTSISCVMVKADSGSDLRMLAEAISQECPGTVAVVTSELVSGVSAQFVVVEAMCIAFLAAILVIAGIALAGRFSALVAARSKELALMRSIGVSGTRVAGSVVLEAGIMSLAGWAAGSLAGCVLAAVSVDWIRTSFEMPGIAVDAGVYATSIALSAVLVVVLMAASLVHPLFGVLHADFHTALSRGDL